MMVNLTPRAQELLQAALARSVGRSPEEVIERALETVATSAAPLSEEEREPRRQAVASMLAFREEFHLTLGFGERTRRGFLNSSRARTVRGIRIRRKP
jgi:hypothetical protein